MGYNVYSNCGIGLAGGTNPGITRTPNVDGWRAPNQPDPLPCCEPQQVRSWELENLLNGFETVIDPLLTSIETSVLKTQALKVLEALNAGKIDASAISNKGFFSAAVVGLAADWETATGQTKDNDKYLFVNSYLSTGSLSTAGFQIGKTDLTSVYQTCQNSKWYMIEPDQYDSVDWGFVQLFSNCYVSWLYFNPANFVV